MSCVAYKAGVMAADRLAYLGKGEPTHARKSKIYRLQDGSLLGIVTSVVGASAQLLDWAKRGFDPDDPSVKDRWPDSFGMLLVEPDGTMRYWDDGFWPQTPEADCMAIGSGGNYALGAMEVGATALAAVRAAARFDCFTCSEVEHLRLHEGQGDAAE